MASLHGFFLADGGELSMLMLLGELMAAEDPGARQAFRIGGGNDRLAAAIAGRLAKDAILLEREVVAITQTESGVRVSLRDGVLEAGLVIITAPATAVRRIRFDPALPAEQHRAIDTLSYGYATKTLLQCTHPFWRTTDQPRAYGTNLDVGALWDGSKDSQDARPSSYRSPADRRAHRRRSCCARKDRKDSSLALAGCAHRRAPGRRQR